MNPFPRKMPQVFTVEESLLQLVEPAAAAVPRARQDQVLTIEKGSLLQLVEPPPAAVTRVRQELPEGRGRLTSAHSAPSARAHMYKKNPVKGEGN